MKQFEKWRAGARFSLLVHDWCTIIYDRAPNIYLQVNRLSSKGALGARFFGLPLYVVNILAIRINCIHRITPTIRIRTHHVILLAQRVHPVPPAEHGVVLAGTVVVGVQTVHAASTTSRMLPR